MSEFNLENGYDFVSKIQYLQAINNISLVDTWTNGDFKVNNQTIFLDTIQQDKPNYYSYKKRANELNISSDSLRMCLESFYKIGVNEFNRESNFYRFRVVVGFAPYEGYIYSEDKSLHDGDTLLATTKMNQGLRFRVLLTKQIDEKCFEYREIN